MYFRLTLPVGDELRAWDAVTIRVCLLKSVAKARFGKPGQLLAQHGTLDFRLSRDT